MEQSSKTARELYEAIKAKPTRPRFGFGRKPMLINIDLQKAYTAVGEFATAYEEEFGGAPGTYAAEAYDAANIFLDGIAEGIDNREDMLSFINEYNEQGVTKQLQFDETGEPSDVHVYAYSVEGGAIVSDQEIE